MFFPFVRLSCVGARERRTCFERLEQQRGLSLRLIEGFVIGLGLPRLIVIVVVGVVTARVIEIGLLYYSKSAIFLRFSDPITEDARVSKHRPISFLKRFYLKLHPHALTLPTCKCMFFIMSRFFCFHIASRNFFHLAAILSILSAILAQQLQIHIFFALSQSDPSRPVKLVFVAVTKPL